MRRALVGGRGAGHAGRRRRAGLRRRRGSGRTLIPDPFGTAALRAAVLDAWAASPTRFREDANAEEDLRLGGYARSWFAELVQNAADAARAAGVPGRVRVTVEAGELRVANTGAPLDAAGVAALASLRASAKREGDAVGRFGVGFAAVLALTDEPRVVSAGGGVAFSAARTAAAVAGLTGPAAELARRGGQLPVLRLVWPMDATAPPRGYVTEVRLPLRDGVDAAALLDAARTQSVTLLLALPGLVEVDVAGTVVRRADDGGEAVITVDGRASRWLLARRSGVLDAAETAGLAVERRDREWTVCWALPLAADGRPAPLPRALARAAPAAEQQYGSTTRSGGDSGGAGDVLHAPTATVERMSLPARLVATVPLDPDRRHVRAGPVTDRVLAGAADAYVDLARAVDPAHRLALLPPAGFPRSTVDGRVRELVVDALRGLAWLPGAAGTDLAPDRAEWLDIPEVGGLPALLAECGAFPGLLAPLPGLAALSALGVARVGPAALADRLLGVEMPPSWWHAVYAALAVAVDTVPGLAGELRALPIPLLAAGGSRASAESSDSPCRGPRLAQDRTPTRGRTVPGPAAVLLPAVPPEPGIAALAALGLPGLHVAHPDAVHPLLARLGAAPAHPAALLDHPAVVAAVERSVDDAAVGLDPRPLAAVVLALVTGPRPDLAALALPAADGGVARADELMLPDAALRPLLADDAPLGVLDPAWVARFPRDVLASVGVVDGFAVLVDDDAAGPEHDLHDEARWWDTLDAPPARLLAVRDLDLVADDAWPAALALLAGRRDTRAALLAVPSYAAWWLARHARLHGHRPAHWRLPAATALTALYDPLPPLACDDVVLAAIGVRADLHVADADAAADLLARLADPARSPEPALVVAAHAALAGAVRDGRVDPPDLDPPDRVRALDGSVVDVDVAVVLDRPWLAAALPAGETVAGGDPEALAELLDLPLASEVVAAAVDGEGKAARWAELPEVVLACQALDVEVPEGGLRLHDTLAVSVTRPTRRRVAVPAWRDDTGRWHATDPVRALLGLLAC